MEFGYSNTYLVITPARLLFEVQRFEAILLFLMSLFQLFNVLLAQPLFFFLAVQFFGQVCLALLQRVQLNLSIASCLHK